MINTLPDEVLLEIFDMCRKKHNASVYGIVWRWLELVHVCRRWRYLIFGSPRGLDLQLLCTHGTPVRESLDIWPPLPIVIQYHHDKSFTPYDASNLLAALENPVRIHKVDLFLTGTRLAEVATVMQQPLPALTHLTVQWVDKTPPPLPNGFLGGSSPCLQRIYLDGILYPALPALLLSTSDLVDLTLINIPLRGYISPESIVACLATLPRLKSFLVEYFSATSHIVPTRLPPVTRSLLPTLTFFGFQGDSEYLEDLVSRIDSPRLNRLSIFYLIRPPGIQFTQLFKFIDRSEDPGLSVIKHADILFSPESVKLETYPCPGRSLDSRCVTILIDCHQIETQVFHISQVFSQPSTMLSRVVHLKLIRYQNGADVNPNEGEWLYLFRQLSTVRTLHVNLAFVKYIARALKQASGEVALEVLPVVDLIFLDGLSMWYIKNFIFSRRYFGLPVTVVNTQAEFDERVKSYFD